MNTKGFTLIELVVSIAIILILASVVVPHYNIALGKSKETVDYNSLLVLDDATNAYAMLNGIALSEVFEKTSSHKEKILKLVDENYLMQDVEPAQEECAFEWDNVKCKWTLSGGAESEEAQQGGEDSESYGGQDPDDSEEGGQQGNGNGNGGNGNCGGNGHGYGCGHGWRWRHGYGWQWYDDEGCQANGDDAYEYYGFGCSYFAGTKVWMNGDYYISHNDTDAIPGHSSDWQKLGNQWHEYNTYYEGDVTTYDGKEYVAKKSSCGKNPASKKSHWQLSE